jgi:hypothetical protein
MNRIRATFSPFLFVTWLVIFSASCGGGGGSSTTSSGGGGTTGSGAPSGPPAIKFAPRIDIPVPGTKAFGLAVVDSNGDHRPDLVVSNEFNFTASLPFLENTGSGNFAVTKIGVINGVSEAHALAAGDLNEDGVTDVLVATDQGVVPFLIFPQGPIVANQMPAVANSGEFLVARLVDFNGDHHLDMVLGNFGSIQVALGKGDGTFNAPFSLPPFLPASQPSLFTFGLDVGDFNRDGKVDILAADYSPNSVGLGATVFYAGNGDGTFAAPTSQTLNLSGPTSVSAVDFNKDGNLDALVGYAPGSASVVLGNGNGTFKTDFADQKVAYAAGSGGQGVQAIAADLNGDGFPDSVAVDYTRGTVIVTPGKGSDFDQTIAARQTFTIAPGLAAVVTADFNADGLPDIAVLNSQTNVVSVFLSQK